MESNETREQKERKLERKINTGVGIAIGVCTLLHFSFHTPAQAMFFLCLALFEWWYVRKLIKESDGPKPAWYPFKIALAFGILALLFASFGSPSSHHYDPEDNNHDGDMNFGR